MGVTVYKMCGIESVSLLSYTTEIVTLMPKLPLSANSCAIDVSNTRQSEFKMAVATPSCIDLGIASQVNRRRGPFNSRRYANPSASFRDPINCTMAKNC